MSLSKPADPAAPSLAETPLRLRNPDLSRTAAAADVARPLASDLPGGSVASNGYWIHDRIGPRHYIGPHLRIPPGRTPEDLVEAIEDRMAGMAGLDVRHVQVTFDGDGLALTGWVADAASRRRIGSCATSVAAGLGWTLTLHNRIRIIAAAEGGRDAQ